MNRHQDLNVSRKQLLKVIFCFIGAVITAAVGFGIYYSLFKNPIVIFAGTAVAALLLHRGYSLLRKTVHRQRIEEDETDVITANLVPESLHLILEPLESNGWNIQYDLLISRWGNVDCFAASPFDKYFCIEINYTDRSRDICFNGDKLIQKFAEQVYYFDQDILKIAKGKAVWMQKMKKVSWVIPIVCFAKAEVEASILNKEFKGVYVTNFESIVNLLKQLKY